MPLKQMTRLAIGVAFALCTTQMSLAAKPAPHAIASESTAAAPSPQAGAYSNISNAQLQTLIDEGVVLIDIRREDEWRATGLVESSTPLTFFLKNGQLNPQFAPELLKLAPIDQPIALICRSGNRTRYASAAIAQQLGYKQVLNVTHGITGWLADNRAVVAYKPQ